MIADEFIRSGQNVRKYYQRRLPSDPSKDYYYILRDTPNNESVIVEYGFADSKGDDPTLLKNNWEDLAEAVVRAVSSYVGVPYNVGSTGANSYVVKSGDTLWGIAKKFGVSVDELKEKNNLTSNNLKLNQVLLIPSKDEVTGDIYIVQAGDSLYSISRRYGLTVDELKRLNNLTSNSLSIGQRLIVKGEAPVSPGENSTYVVKAGDSLYKIANQFGTTVEELMRLNQLTSNTLSIGQILTLPKANNNQEIHIVKAGDNLYSIARMHNTTVDDIKRVNNLSSNLLTIGQKLIIP